MQPDSEVWNKTFSAATNWTVVTASTAREELSKQVSSISAPTCFLLEEGLYVFPDTPIDTPFPLVFRGLQKNSDHRNGNSSSDTIPAVLDDQDHTSTDTPPPPPPPIKKVVIRNGNKACPVIIIDSKAGCVFEGISFVSDSMNGCVVVRDGPAKFIDCHFRMTSRASSCAAVQIKQHCALMQCDLDGGAFGVQIHEPESPFNLSQPEEETRPANSSPLRAKGKSSPSSSSLRKSARPPAGGGDSTINVKIEDCGFSGSLLRDGIGAFGMCKLFCSHISVDGVAGTGIILGGASGGFVKDSLIANCGRGGIVAECATSVWLRQCSVESCGGIGIQVCGMARPSVMGCNIEGNALALAPQVLSPAGDKAAAMFPPPQVYVSGASAPTLSQNEINGLPVSVNDVGVVSSSCSLVVISDAASGSFEKNTLKVSKGDKGVILDGNTSIIFKGNIITVDVDSLVEAYEDAGKTSQEILDGVLVDESVGSISPTRLRSPRREKAPLRYYGVTLGPWQAAKLMGGNRLQYHDISGSRNSINKNGDMLIQGAPTNALFVSVDQLPSWSPYDWVSLSQIPDGLVEREAAVAAAAASASSDKTAIKLRPRRPESRNESNTSARDASATAGPKGGVQPHKPHSGNPNGRAVRPTSAKMSSESSGGARPTTPRSSTPLTHSSNSRPNTAGKSGRSASRLGGAATTTTTSLAAAKPSKDYEKEINQLKSTISQLRARLRSGSTSDSPRRLWNQHEAAPSKSTPHDRHSQDGSDSPRVFTEEVRVGRFVWDKSRLKDFNKMLVPLSEIRREVDGGSEQRIENWRTIPSRLHDSWLKSRKEAQQTAAQRRDAELDAKPKLTVQQQQEMAHRMHDESMRQKADHKERIRDAVIQMEKESRFSTVLHSSRHQTRPRDRFGEPTPLTPEEIKEFNERIYYEHKAKKEELMKQLHDRYDRVPSPPYLSREGRARKKASAKELELYCASLHKAHRDADAAAKAAEVIGRPIAVREGKTHQEMYPPLIPSQKVYPRAEIEAYCASLHTGHKDGYPEALTSSSSAAVHRRPNSASPRLAAALHTASPSPAPAASRIAISANATSPPKTENASISNNPSPTRATSSMGQVAAPPASFTTQHQHS